MNKVLIFAGLGVAGFAALLIAKAHNDKVLTPGTFEYATSMVHPGWTNYTKDAANNYTFLYADHAEIVFASGVVRDTRNLPLSVLAKPIIDQINALKQVQAQAEGAPQFTPPDIHLG